MTHDAHQVTEQCDYNSAVTTVFAENVKAHSKSVPTELRNPILGLRVHGKIMP